MSDLNLLLTFSHENFSELQRYWRDYAADHGSQSVGTTRQEDERWGGKVQLVDWRRKVATTTADVLLATGTEQLADRLVVCSYRSLEFLDETLTVRSSLRHPLFCNLHSVSEHPDGLLVTASGIDAILLVEKDESVSVFWSGLADGYDRLRDGSIRTLDLAQDHSETFYPTSAQTTHVNGATYLPARGSVVATLFHQGELIEIGPDDRSRVLVAGLASPHSPRIRPDGTLYFADTRNGRICEVGGPDEIRFIDLATECPWLQNVHWAESHEAYVVADSTNRRILLVDPDGSVVDSYRFGADWRVHEARPLRPAAAPAATGGTGR